MARYPGAIELIGLQVVGKDVPIPLKFCSVKASLNGYVVGLDSTLKYVNEDTSPVEVVFRFPVDQAYAVVGLEAVIGGKRIKAQLKEKEEAKQDYDDAVASGFTAAFAEEKSGDIFSISLGNLPPRAEAELNLKLVGELPIDAEGAVRFSLPAVLKPRYNPLGSTDPLSQLNSAVQGKAPSVYSFDMVVKKEGVASVSSPTHSISDKHDGDCIRITQDAKPLDKDLIILVNRSNPHLPTAVCELGDSSLSQRSYMGAPAVMLSFFPEFESKRAACEFVFLVDRSGSMSGSYIESASQTLVLFLKSVPPGCTFNIIGFGSRFTSLFPNAVPYNQENLDVAIRHAENLNADLGGTELLSPLQHIFQQRATPGLPRQVFVLTDGSVSNTQACINEVTRNVANSRVFTFGIGSGASTALVNGLAKAGNGTAEFIKEGERMQPKVIRSLKRALQPSVTDVEVDFQLTSGFKAFQAPAKIPTIFKGDKIVVYGIFKSKATSDAPLEAGLTGTATIKGQILDSPITDSIMFEVPPPPTAGEKEGGSLTGFEIPVVHHLAAKSLLSDWSNGLGWSATALTDERKQEMIKLSIESSVVSEHTAFVAYDVDQSQPIKGAMQVWDLTASMAEQSVYHQLSSFGGGGGGRGGAMMKARSAPMKKMKSKKGTFTSGPPPPPPGGARFCSAGLPPSAPMLMGSGPPPPPMAMSCPPPPPMALSGLQPVLKGRSGPPELARDCAAAPPPAAMQFQTRSAFRMQAAVKPSSGETDALTLLVSLQQAAGYWSLKAVADKIIKKKGAMDPPQGVSTEVWATILALIFLEVRCAAQKDEWELIAMKAEAWLATQTFSEITLPSLQEKAKEILAG